MSSKSITAEELKELLQCSFCLSSFSSPRVLACLHTFCASCIEENITPHTENGVEGTTCPYCRQFSPTSETQPNIYFTQLLQLYERFIKSKVCGTCLQEGAVWKCLQCAEFFCDVCKDNHKQEEISHELDRVCNELVLNEPVFCDKHESKTVTRNCAQCATLLCDACAPEEHADHVTESIGDALKRYLGELQSKVVDVKANASLLREQSKKLAVIHEKINSDYEAALEMVTKQRTEVIAKVNARFDTIKKQLKEIKEAESHKAMTGIETREGCACAADVLVSNAETTIATTRDALLLKRIQSQLLPRFLEVGSSHKAHETLPEVTYPRFQPQMNSDAQILKLGAVEAKETYSNNRYYRKSFENLFEKHVEAVDTIDIDFQQMAIGYRITYGFHKIGVCFWNLDTVTLHSTGDGDTRLDLRLQGKCPKPKSAVFITDQILAIAAENGLHLVDINSVVVVRTIIKEETCDVCRVDDVLYALHPTTGNITSFVPAEIGGQEAGTSEREAGTSERETGTSEREAGTSWQERTVVDTQIDLSPGSTLVASADIIAVCNSVDKIVTFGTDGTKLWCFPLDNSHFKLTAINAQGDLLITNSQEQLKKLKIIKNNSEKEARDCTIAGARKTWDVIFKDARKFWLLEPIKMDKGLYQLKGFEF